MTIMEEILFVILQLLFEFVLQLLLYSGFDLAAWAFGKEDKGGSVGCAVMFVFLLLGSGLGGLANWIHPGAFLPYEWMRIANLLAGPPLAGGASWLFAEVRKHYGAKLLPSLHFWFAFCFVLGFDLVRFVYLQR
jgi:hypothetical protein